MKERECSHVRRGVRSAITTIRHSAIAGAPTHVDDLETTTRLCVICSGALIVFLQRAEAADENEAVERADTILMVPPDVDVEALGEHVLNGAPIPPGCYTEPIEVWMARGRVDDCDCGLLQCACVAIRPHGARCAFRLSITSPYDCGETLACNCGALGEVR